MQEYEEKKKHEIVTNGVKDPIKSNAEYRFMTPNAKAVPDFKRLQLKFQQALEDQKKENLSSATELEPFNFHNPKSTASMRRHLDHDNQMINPTIKKVRALSALAHGGNKDLSPVKERDSKENPANTAKFNAYVETRRHKMEQKKNLEQAKFQEDVERFFKQTRLA